MRIFGDPSDGAFTPRDYGFLGLLPIPFDLAYGTIVFGPYSVQASGAFVPGAVAGEGFMPGALAAQAVGRGGAVAGGCHAPQVQAADVFTPGAVAAMA